MTTAPSTLINLQAKCSHNLGTTNLGIVGDEHHIETGGYHIGAASLRQAGMGNDYSLTYAIDRNATHNLACAFDLGGPAPVLMMVGDRLVHALINKDPRVYGRIRGVNAPFSGVSIDRRYDTENPNTSADDNIQSSDDRGHIHVEVFRTLVTNQKVIDGLYSVLAGEPLEDDMPLTPDELEKIANAVWGKVLFDTSHARDAVRDARQAAVAARNAAQSADKTLDEIKTFLKIPDAQ